MTDRNKFEEMLERLINEDKTGAEELFHEIVVEKSRDIYESLLEADEEVEETEEDEVEESTDEEVDEATDEEVEESDEDLDEGFDLDEFEVEADPMDMPDDEEGDMPGMDATDDMMGDIEGDDEAEGSEEGVEDAMDDLQAALEKLQAEFDAMTGDSEDDDDDEEEPEEEGFQFESDDEEVDEATDEEVDEATDEEVDESAKSAGELMREYADKVSPAKMGDNGVNTKSTVANPNKMGGTAANIVSGDESKGEGTQGGLVNPSTQEENLGNRNVPGGKAGSLETAPKATGGDDGDKSAASPTNGVKSRAK